MIKNVTSLDGKTQLLLNLDHVTSIFIINELNSHCWGEIYIKINFINETFLTYCRKRFFSDSREKLVDKPAEKRFLWWRWTSTEKVLIQENKEGLEKEKEELRQQILAEYENLKSQLSQLP